MSPSQAQAGARATPLPATADPPLPAVAGRYTSLIDHIEQAITLQDANGRLHYQNPAARRIFGVSLEAATPDAAAWADWQVMDAAGQPLQREAFPAARALREGRPIGNEVVGLYHPQTQQLLWLSVTALPQFSSNPERTGMVLSMSTDITALQRDKTLFQRVQELAQVGGWQWNRGSDALYLTHESARILRKGTPPASMQALLDGLYPLDRQRLRDTLASIRGDTGFDLELAGRDSSDTPFWIRMIGEPEPHDPGGNLLSGTLTDITERRHAEEALRQQARTDALTGLLNRSAILEHIGDGLAAPGGPDLALLYIDLDRFKIVNDMLGHDAGDLLLVDAARRIRGAVGDEGRIARFGGDEFLVTCALGDDPARPERLARAIQCAFLPPFRMGKDEFSITTSIGISHAPAGGQTPRQLIQSADVAMYDSKHRHRNGFQVFSPRLAKRQQERLQTETLLRRALDNGEFHLAYQPQVDLRSGRILHAEALLRWHSPQLGEVPPDRFIDLAESTGEIVRIGHWVLGEACAQMRRWQEQGLPIQRVAVNVSYRQFLGEDLVASVQEMLAGAGLPGHALELELTERVLVEDVADASRTFAALRKLGVHLSIDDFGEGYSALNYLRRLPIHALKLSHSFIKSVPGTASDEAICQTVAGIARSLGLGLVAEGIENERQRDFLLRLGVNVGQGFLFAPGLPPGEFGRRLAKQKR